MTGEAWLDRFRRHGALQEGHFLLTSGLHSPAYVQSALILQYPEEAEALGRALADLVCQRIAPEDLPRVVLGPALGGVVLAHEVARALGARALFAERTDGRLGLRRGFAVGRGERVLLVEDVMTTGGTVLEAFSLVEESGGVVAGIATLVDRTGGRWSGPLALDALLRLDLETFPPEACPFCRAGLPAVKPGSRQPAP